MYGIKERGQEKEKYNELSENRKRMKKKYKAIIRPKATFYIENRERKGLLTVPPIPTIPELWMKNN